MGAFAALPQLASVARMSGRQHAQANAVASRPAAFHSRLDVAPRLAATKHIALTPRPPSGKRLGSSRRMTQRKPTADELVLGRLNALHPRKQLSDELVAAHLRAEMRRLQRLTSNISRMAQQADERVAWLREEIARNAEQLRRLSDPGAQRLELTELRTQNRSLRLELGTALQNEENRARQTLAKISVEGLRQVATLSPAATAHMLALLRQDTEPADVTAIKALRQAQPNASDRQVVRYLRAEVRRLANELSSVLVLEHRAHRCVAEAEETLNALSLRFQELGSDSAMLEKIAIVSAQNATLRRLAQQPPDVCGAMWCEPSGTDKADQAAATELLQTLQVDDKEALRLGDHRWAEPFVRAVIEQQNAQERGEMVVAATKIAAVMRGKAARARARSVKVFLSLSLSAF